MDAVVVEPSPSPSISSQDVPKVKRRRLPGSCDACSKKKIKCDSANMPDNACTNCQASNIQCRHTIPRRGKKKKEPEDTASYVRSLEERLLKMERLLANRGQTPPDKGTQSFVSSSPGEGSEILKSFSDTKKTLYSEHRSHISDVASKSLNSASPQSAESVESDQESETDDLAHVALAEHLSQLYLKAIDDRFFGQSSTFMFAKEASTVRSEITGAPSRPDSSRFRRPLYWDIQPWEEEFSFSSTPFYVYPEEDLLQTLVSLYFEKMNTFFPLLHQPTFRKSLSIGQHLRDTSFGMTVLLVCAIGSRYCNDKRVLMPGDNSGFSSGWQYFSQVQIYRNSMILKTTIYDLQYYVLAVLYLGGSAVPHNSWHILAIGMRYALEKGAHRRKRPNQRPSAEEELLKRAFWCLLSIDYLKASFLGRPCVIQDEDYDVDYPIECDDEYWNTEDAEQAFKQPPGKPCTISSFVRILKLCEILAFALRTLYSTKKSKMLSGLTGDEWERRVVLELDSSMNKWKDSIPNFLVWDPNISVSSFFHQSLFLHVIFSYVQILIHRPFLTKKSPLSFPSLAMCTNAARSCIHILEVGLTRGIRPTHQLLVAAFSAGIVIILNLWGHQRSGLIGENPAREMADLQKCITVLKECERKWHVAGRFCDMLNELGSLREYQLTVNKRPREDTGPTQHEHATTPSSATSFAPSIMRKTGLVSETPFDSDRLTILPNFDPPTRMNGLELNDPMRFQTGYGQSHSGDGAQQEMNGTALGVGGNMSQLDMGLSFPTLDSLPSFMTNEDMLSLWSDIPAAFSIDEWDAYLHNMIPVQP